MSEKNMKNVIRGIVDVIVSTITISEREERTVKNVDPKINLLKSQAFPRTCANILFCML